MRLNRLWYIIVALMFASSIAGANAASLGGLDTRSLGAWSVPGGTGAPNVVTWANFTGADSTDLNGHALDGPGTWSVTGAWTIQANQAAASNVAAAKLWVPVGTVNASALATLTFGVTARAGLVALDDGSRAIYAYYSKASGGTVELYKLSGSESLLASVTGVGTPSSATMKLDATTNTMKVSFAGTEVLTHTLSGADVAKFKDAGSDGFGVMADSDTLTRFDDFHVDS